MNINDRVERTNDFGQRRITGTIVLRRDVEMLNRANDGRNMLAKLVQPALKDVPAGTEVHFIAQETRVGWYQTVELRIPSGGHFYETVRTDTFEGQDFQVGQLLK